MQPKEFGVIHSWVGSVANIPKGWLLCDGTNGTPDMRNRFIPGSGDTYTPGDAGGAVNHNHAFTGDGHTHSTKVALSVVTGAPFLNVSSSESAVGTTDDGSSLPPYYSLAYIMYVGEYYDA